MKTVGQALFEARSGKGITLAEAERATKIRAEILESLEANDFESLPGTTYIKGFIKNYGDFLGLDSYQLLALFRRQFSEAPPTRSSFIPNLTPLESPKLRLTPSRALGLGVSILVLGFLGYLLAQYQSFAAAPLLVVTQPSDHLKVNNGTVEVVGRTDRDAKLRINGQEVQLTESGAFSVSVTLPDGVNDLAFSAVNKLGRVTTITRQVSVETSVAASPLGPTSPNASPPPPAVAATSSAKPLGVEVTLKIGPNAAWIRVQADATTLEKLFLAGTSQTFTAQNQIVVRTGNAGSTEVILNGASQGKMGEEAQVATKTYTH